MSKEQTHPDLFKDGETPIGKEPKGWAQKKKRRMGYHEAREDEPSCADCDHLIKQTYHDKNYYKCDLIGISRSEATDIRLKDTCNKNTEKESDNEGV